MHDVLKVDVGVKHFTYCPSMYHSKKRDWTPTDKLYVQVAKDKDVRTSKLKQTRPTCLRCSRSNTC